MNVITINSVQIEIVSATRRPGTEYYNICTRTLWELKTVYRMSSCAFVFGDNCERCGRAGQACIRGLKNAYGVATKWSPKNEPGAYFTDGDSLQLCRLIDQDVERIPRDRHVIWHEGIGSGLARLPKHAPKVYEYLMRRMRGL